MQLNIKNFGLLAEVTRCNEKMLSFSKSSIGDLLHDILNKYPDLKSKEFQVAKKM